MRIPWLRVDVEAIERAPALAGILSIPETQAMGILIYLWRFALSQGHHSERPDGWIRGAFISGRIAGACHWREDPERLVQALQVLGFLDLRNPENARVRGLSRYARTFEKNDRPNAKLRAGSDWARQKPGKSPAKARQKPGAGPAEVVPVEVDIEETKEDLLRDVGRAAVLGPVDSVGRLDEKFQSSSQPTGSAVVIPVKQKKKPSRQQQAFEWFRSERSKLTDESDREPTAQNLNTLVGPILDELGVPGFARCARGFFESKKGAELEPKFAWRFFVAEWRQWRNTKPLNGSSQLFHDTKPGEDPYRTEKKHG